MSNIIQKILPENDLNDKLITTDKKTFTCKRFSPLSLPLFLEEQNINLYEIIFITIIRLCDG